MDDVQLFQNLALSTAPSIKTSNILYIILLKLALLVSQTMM